ncbi:MAG: nucleotide exchange factor GrpE [Bacteroidetes bacterium]|nr:MAG: nucleotide exchange factor GrpE [Bacteroidota bacterium]
MQEQQETTNNTNTQAETITEITEVEATTETKVEEKQQTAGVNIVEQLAAELAESKEKYLRLYAEFDNFRRRTAKEKTDLIITAGEKVLVSMLPILDDFERSMKSIQKTIDKENPTDAEISAVKDGVGLIFNKMLRILEQQGLKAMENTIGQVFDIDKHESITQIPAPSEDMKGKVVDEVEKGYILGEKIVRFTKVVVGS